jgi:peptidoglycan/LPS O-acetylase OafA/YrhL
MGVMIFFALSGYLITTRLLDEHRKNGRISLRDFYLRRAFRILPPALTYLGVVTLLASLGVIVCSWSSISGALLFYINYLNEPGYVGHFWSLSVEEHFYLFWPGLLVLFGVVAGWRTAAAFAVALALWRIGDTHFHIVARALNAPYLQGNEYRTDLTADALLWGCVLAFVKARSSAAVSTSVAIVTAILMVWIELGVPGAPTKLGYLAQSAHFLPALLLWAVVSCPGAPIGRLLELRATRFIGNLSYSLYIWQQLFLRGPGQKLPVLIGLAAAFACAYLSYRYIEQPAIRWGKKFSTPGGALPQTA